MIRLLPSISLVILLCMLLCSSAIAQGSSNTPPRASINVVIIIIPPSGGSDKKSVDGSPSTDPDGRILRYEWDLDGNGSFERDSGAESFAHVPFEEAGQYLIGLRVTDDDGASDTVYQWVTLQ